MSVTSICTYNVATIGPKQGVMEAAVRMREEHVGDLIVVEQREGVTVPIGILTDRDIVLGVVAKGVPVDAVTVSDAMPCSVTAFLLSPPHIETDRARTDMSKSASSAFKRSIIGWGAVSIRCTSAAMPAPSTGLMSRWILFASAI